MVRNYVIFTIYDVISAHKYDLTIGSKLKAEN